YGTPLLRRGAPENGFEEEKTNQEDGAEAEAGEERVTAARKGGDRTPIAPVRTRRGEQRAQDEQKSRVLEEERHRRADAIKPATALANVYYGTRSAVGRRIEPEEIHARG